MSLKENAFKLSAKRILIRLGLTVAASPTDAAISKKMFGMDRPLHLAPRKMISNEDLNDSIEIIKSLEESELLIKEILAKQLQMTQNN